MESFTDYLASLQDYLRKLFTIQQEARTEGADVSGCYRRWKETARMLCIISRRLVYSALREGIPDPGLLNQTAEALEKIARSMEEKVPGGQGDQDVTKYRDHIAKGVTFFTRRAELTRSSEKAIARLL